MSKRLGAWMLWILVSRIRVTDWVKVVPWRVKGKTKSWNSVRKLDPNLQDLVYFWILDQESWYTRCEAYQNTWWDRSLAYDVVHRGQRWAEWPSTFASSQLLLFATVGWLPSESSFSMRLLFRNVVQGTDKNWVIISKVQIYMISHEIQNWSSNIKTKLWYFFTRLLKWASRIEGSLNNATDVVLVT